MVIYKIRNIVNNKCYVGSAVNYRKRKNKHISELERGIHHCEHLQRAWIKYGRDQFVFEIIEKVELKSRLILREQYWIDFYSFKNIYNSCPVAYSRLGYVMPEEIKRKISKANKGHKLSEETKKKISDANKGRKHSEQSKKKMSESRKGRKAWNKGLETPENIKNKISNSLRGRTSPMKGRKHSKETIQKMSENRSGEGNSRAVFTNEQAKQIREEYALGEISQRNLAKKYGVSRGAIRGILLNRTYKDLK